MTKMKPYEKAGRVIRLFAWIQVVAIVGIGAAIAIPMMVSGRAASAPPPWAGLLIILVVIVGLTVFQLIMGTAVKEHKDWGRIVGIIYGILTLFGFPIGTLVGAYILWCLLKGWEEQPISA
jgi:predicted exporter